MRRQDDRRTSPRWRGVLEARWRARLDEVTELSLAYHAAADAAAGVGGGGGGGGGGWGAGEGGGKGER
jgi:hypothetical protein